MELAIVGVDCATQPSRVGLALAVWSEGCGCELRCASSSSRPPVQVVARWVEEVSPRPVLIAMDAPLGWPAPMGIALSAHRAGTPIEVHPHTMFRRHTDRVVSARLGKTPLDVGADRIARTAHAALQFLRELRALTRRAVDVVWSAPGQDIGVIEVYPSATLVARGWPSRGYKKAHQLHQRRAIVALLSGALRLSVDTAALDCNPDVLDAVVCVLADLDFVDGSAAGPDDAELAAKEGWIWVRGRTSTLPEPTR